MENDEGSKDEKELTRRDALKTMGAFAAGVVGAVTATESAQAAEQAAGACEVKNPYGGRPGGGISLPPYFKPTPYITGSRANYFPLSEKLPTNEMRISSGPICHYAQTALRQLSTLKNRSNYSAQAGKIVHAR